MKRFTHFCTFMLLALMSFTFVSCDEDDEIAYTLEGTWRGNMYAYVNYDGYEYYSTYSELCFLRDPYTYSSGDGYWVDYYSRAPWDYVANHIRWTVNNGVIRVRFIEKGSSVEIYDYRLSDNYFTGTIFDKGNYVDFSLKHVSSPNWNDFEWGWDYWYGAKQQAAMKSKGIPFKENVRPVTRFGVNK